MPGRLNVDDLDDTTRKRLGVRKPRMTMDQVRGHALSALVPLREFTRDERRRILRHAIKVNEV